MIKDKNALLLLLQALLLIGLVWLEFAAVAAPAAAVRWGLLAALLAITGVQGWVRFDFRRQQAALIAALQRAIQGNLNTRLLTNELHWLDEIVFAINRLIEQLDNCNIQTIKSETARKRLLSNFSHDIRTPLTSIIGYMDALKDDIGASEEEKREYIEIVLRKANALKLLVDEIFHLAKLDADEMPLKMERLDLAELIREAVIDFLPELNRHAIALQADIPEDVCPVQADRVSLQRILGNLIKNAIQYGQDGGVLGVQLQAAAGEFRVCVWDRGVGIAAEDLNNIFERLYRADQARSAGRGSGLGLSIARALVEKNGGTIWVESAPGEQTSFIFTLPDLRNN